MEEYGEYAAKCAFLYYNVLLGTAKDNTLHYSTIQNSTALQSILVACVAGSSQSHYFLIICTLATKQCQMQLQYI